jgi:hypothetical protein
VIELRGSHRITTGYAAEIMIGRAVPPPPAMAPSTHLLPVASNSLGEFGNGRGFAARCPPMGNFKFSQR